MDTLLTAETAASSPNFRRRSSIFIDAIHDLPEKEHMAPAQLYSTESGRLFHSGRIVITTVGLPARGKTHISVSLARYLRWLGVKTHVFHLGDYRRATLGPGQDVPPDYFFVNASPAAVLLRKKILKKCREDIYQFLEQQNGQVAIYDAVNAISAGRRALAKEFSKRGIQTLFIESKCEDERIIEENVRSVKISSPDYIGWNEADAVKDYLARINSRIPHFETMEERDLHWITLVDAGKRMLVNDCAFGYLSQRIVFYLMNLHIKSRRVYFARAGTTREEDSYKADASLSQDGVDYSKKMGDTLIAHREGERQALIDRGGPSDALKPLSIWTSTRRRTIETSLYLANKEYRVRQRSQMSQLNPGVCEKMSEKRIREEFPEEVAKHEQDPYHHRYPRAESYHDLAVRLEPIILELEREENDILIIAHESVLRVLYGYLMACNAADIPKLEFPRNEIIEIIPASYDNTAKRIYIPDLNLPVHLIPGSPEDISIPVPPSERGSASPYSGTGTPAMDGATSPRIEPMQPPSANAAPFKRLSSVDEASVGSSPHPPPGGWDVTPQIVLDSLGVASPTNGAGEPKTVQPQDLPLSSISAAPPRSIPSHLAERVHDTNEPSKAADAMGLSQPEKLHTPATADELANASAWEAQLKAAQGLGTAEQAQVTASAKAEDHALHKDGHGAEPAHNNEAPPQPLKINDTHIDPKS